ncbi:fimbria/pilus outer membrane usher protein [Pantoea sp. GM01]|uniref:fimbria/pilus outer membrane usher protein n=1 Tax=Pantoea sp. GM01 TaxID=1144320 RepID=UPI00027125CB|nr:fimbria/pilus outer membrane usher protein [Pantoea sp. GM01]EJL85160.1 P pilus assembly protein, porin PapC [Pantoea sp. GM01]
MKSMNRSTLSLALLAALAIMPEAKAETKTERDEDAEFDLQVLQARAGDPNVPPESLDVVAEENPLDDANSLTSDAAPSAPSSSRSDEVQFDISAMQARGIDPKVADFFRQAPRFMPGQTTVVLTVNGNGRGKFNARFNENGQLCADADFLKAAGLVTPRGFSDQADCFDLQQAWPRSNIALEPGEARIDIVVPPEAVAESGAISGNWDRGGFAGMLNYDAQYMTSTGAASSVNFVQIGSEAGFNLSDWIVRSRQNFSRFNGKDEVQHQAAYAQRSFIDSQKVLQAGQVSLANSMFGAGQVLGFQLFPETALQRNRGGAGLVEGIADTQSVVEVRQSGVLVYSTTVPAGPFRLQGLSLLNSRSDLEVTLTGSSGDKRQFTVPASAFLVNGSAVAPGLSFGAGKMDQQGSSESPLIGTVASGWVLSPHVTLNAGVMAAVPYRAAALGLDTQPLDATTLSLQVTAAQDARRGNNGVSLNGVASRKVTERVSLSVNAAQQTRGYRELSDSLQARDQDISGRSRQQLGVGVSWANESLGNLSLSAAQSATFDGDLTHYLRAGWSRQFGHAYFGVSLEHDTGNRDRAADNRLYATLSLPFGSRSVSSYVNNSSSSTRGGIRYSDRSSQDRGYSLASERDFKNKRGSNSGNLDLVTPVSQLSGGVSHSSDGYTSWSARATGAVVAHDKGITLSSYRVNDTFGIAKVGDEAGVRLETPAGPTWTDSRGYAVLPSLNGYRKSQIQLDTRSLGKNIDIANALQETESARGAVSYVNFDVVRTRRVLVDVKDALGKPLLQGSSVFDAIGNFITVVGSKGAVFIPDASNVGKLDVQSSGKTLCSFRLQLPEKADTSGLYETASAVCG